MSRQASSSFAYRVTRNLMNNSAKSASSATSQTFTYFSTAPNTASSSSSSSSSNKNYVSPYKDLFAMMKTNKTHTSQIPKARPISKLKCGISESVLKFRTTCYDRLMLAPYVNTNEYKVILQVKFKHLPLETDLEKKIFLQIVKTRFDDELQELKLTSNQFASRIENKRHLCWMLDRIVIGAKRLAQETESE